MQMPKMWAKNDADAIGLNVDASPSHIDPVITSTNLSCSQLLEPTAKQTKSVGKELKLVVIRFEYNTLRPSFVERNLGWEKPRKMFPVPWNCQQMRDKLLWYEMKVKSDEWKSMKRNELLNRLWGRNIEKLLLGWRACNVQCMSTTNVVLPFR